MKSADNPDIPFIAPMECLPVNNFPDGPDWIYELKLDGYRGQAIRDERACTRLGERFHRG